ncbi:MPN385 family protein [Mycoplasmoides genitalium]|uniref:Uncharacterized protein MG267 n=2 Tax=Mycoplasmoides genitalium TaxID=2097 RepID=Y267_MYCGE|nr:hypothetical protein [Mycoplasmoides genitalium]P47509.1 RecName: Full=Uncharacterized protein MG267 [Mycoplasmoides genitalium G37]ABY79613.1 conserved hypothetical protein [synthetic Mycoplasma genitalium JCVI-1.0]AAC71489.1 conserved hypothetical protein [Mycoplasmoides genitalium G37]AFQ03100.1 hypothetical protein CM9_01590 [Mycoplasmoides genitalium M2321]AFQ03588.1 hypothetical protein CM3_01695 [Mycoplasmoides genitalium M6282]AFQ04092.1 hypothetical protein CM1_01610 [Mycoplasmoid
MTLLFKLVKIAILVFLMVIGFFIFIGSFWLNTYQTAQWADLLASSDASGIILTIFPNINSWFNATVANQPVLFKTMVHFFIPVGFGLLFGLIIAIIVDILYRLTKYAIKRSYQSN